MFTIATNNSENHFCNITVHIFLFKKSEYKMMLVLTCSYFYS